MSHPSDDSLTGDGQMLDVLVVGAGIAGLHAAWQLQRAGRSVVVCEARSEAGGRLRSTRLPGFEAPLDLGATWIWPIEPRVNALVAELGLSTFRHFDQGIALYDTPTKPQPVPNSETDRAAHRLVGGSAALTDGLHAQLHPGTVIFNATVTKIEQTASQSLRVEFADQPAKLARHAILALPPALAMHRIRFNPLLPADLSSLAAATPVWMGGIVKSIVVYDAPFWRDMGLAGLAWSQIGPLQEIHDHCGPTGSPAALFGFTGLLRASQDPPTPDAIVQQLVRLFGPRAAQPKQVIVQDWSRQPDTSPPNVVTLRSYDLFGHQAYARPYLDGCLHFASCETSGSQGHIEDALNASYRASRAIGS